MRSHSFNLKPAFHLPPPLDLPRRSSCPRCPPWHCHLSDGYSGFKLQGPIVQRHQRRWKHCKAFDDGAFDIPSLDGWDVNEGTSGYVISSSDGDDSDGEIILNPNSDVDLPRVKVSSNDAFTVTAHRFAMIGRHHQKRRIKYGAFINMGLIGFLTICLLLVDWFAWQIVRLPLEPFYLTRPFFISAIVVSCVGFICVPLLHGLHIYQIFREEGPSRHSLKKRTPTMGGLFFVPIGVAVALYIAGFSSTEVTGAAVVTLACAAIGLLDDTLSLFKNQNYGLSSWLRVVLEVAVGALFSMWLDSASISSPYGMYIFLKLI